MPEPVIIPRAEHPISRRDIDPDALKVLYRLQQFNYTAYLVGGSVRDLLLQRRPKDFDVGTDAHPYQIKKLFRNCWIIGRRFRLAHVRFGPKAIEVATFRRNILPGTENEPATMEADDSSADVPPGGDRDLLLRHDNTFGTPEEDAFRRDFTINALFYDIATFSIIDYVGGLQDLKDGIIRSIGEPSRRFEEDPVRMFRAVAFAARLGFRLDRPVIDGIRDHAPSIANAAPARLIEEYYKVLRSGAAEKTFRMLAQHGLLQQITPELQHHSAGDTLWNALAELDRYRQRFDTIPEGLTNPILLGTLLVPLGLMPRANEAERLSSADAVDRGDPGDADEADGDGDESDANPPGARHGRFRRSRRGPKEPPLRIGMLPVARRDTERLRQILSVQRRLMDLESSPRAKRALMHRGPFQEALVWLEIHGRSPEALEHWRGFIEAAGSVPSGEDRPSEDGAFNRRRRRRGRRRRGRGGPNRRGPES